MLKCLFSLNFSLVLLCIELLVYIQALEAGLSWTSCIYLYICTVENPVNQSIARKGFFPFPINRLISYQTLFWFFSPNTSKQISPISPYLKTKPELSALHLRYFINSYSYIKLININAVSVQRLWEDNVNYLFTLTGISSPIIIKSFKINFYHKKIL